MRPNQTKKKISAAELIKRWQGIAARQNVLDLDKAQFAFDSWRCFNRNDQATCRFLCSQLKFAFATASQFVAMAHVFQSTSRQTVMWKLVGWTGMRNISRLKPHDQNKLTAKVRHHARTKKADRVSWHMVRHFIKESGFKLGSPLNPMNAAHGSSSNLTASRRRKRLNQLETLAEDVERLIRAKKLDPSLLSADSLRVIGRLASGPKKGQRSGKSGRRTRVA